MSDFVYEFYITQEYMVSFYTEIFLMVENSHFTFVYKRKTVRIFG